MTEINRDEERQRCRQFYEKWDFIKRIVELYVEGISWKGCKVVTPNEPGKISLKYRQIIDNGAIKNGVRDMVVDGIGDFVLKVIDSVHVLKIETRRESFLQDAEPGGRSLLWPAERNAKALEDMVSLLKTSQNPTHAAQVAEMVSLLEKDMCIGLGVPRGLLQQTVATGDPTVIKMGLIVFRGKVNDLRNHIAFQIEQKVQPLISEALSYEWPIEVDWNENWLPHGGEYGPVYQVFKAQGIELRTLREEALNTAKFGLDNFLISRETYEENVKWFR